MKTETHITHRHEPGRTLSNRKKCVLPVLHSSVGRVIHLEGEAASRKRALKKRRPIKTKGSILTSSGSVKVQFPGLISYRVDTQAVGAADGERVVLVGKDDDIRHGVDSQGVVIGPENRADVQRQRSQMSLRQDGLHKLERRTTRSRRFHKYTSAWSKSIPTP